MAEKSVEDPIRDFTILINRAGAGDADAQSLVWSSAYGELRSMARGARAGYAAPGSAAAPSPTTIIHEAFLKSFAAHRDRALDQRWDSRAHFFGSLARAMAQFLVDWRRTSTRQKRGGGRAGLSLDALGASVPTFEPIADFDQAMREITPELLASLERLQAESPNAAEVVWLRYVGGLTLEETASVLEIGDRAVSKRWNLGRAWLRRDLARRIGLAADRFDRGDADE